MTGTSVMKDLNTHYPYCPECFKTFLSKLKTIFHYYFHTSLWYFKRFYEGFYCLQKTLWGIIKISENEKLSYTFLSLCKIVTGRFKTANFYLLSVNIYLLVYSISVSSFESCQRKGLVLQQFTLFYTIFRLIFGFMIYCNCPGLLDFN